jgi:hypothetical protein
MSSRLPEGGTEARKAAPASGGKLLLLLLLLEPAAPSRYLPPGKQGAMGSSS